MYYEINVSLNGNHFFATAERSITDANKCTAVVAEFLKVFPSDKGYSISVQKHVSYGYITDMHATAYAEQIALLAMKD